MGYMSSKAEKLPRRIERGQQPVYDDRSGVIPGSLLRQLLHPEGNPSKESRLPSLQFIKSQLHQAGYSPDTITVHDKSFAVATQSSAAQNIELTERIGSTSAYFITAQKSPGGEYILICITQGAPSRDAEYAARLASSQDLTAVRTALHIPTEAVLSITIFTTDTQTFDPPLIEKASSALPEHEVLPVQTQEVRPATLVDFTLPNPEGFMPYIEKLVAGYIEATGEQLTAGEFQTTTLLDGAVKMTTIPLTLRNDGMTLTINLAIAMQVGRFRNFQGVIDRIVTFTAGVTPPITPQAIQQAVKAKQMAVLVTRPFATVVKGQLDILQATFSLLRIKQHDQAQTPESLFSPSGLQDIANQVRQLTEVAEITHQGMAHEDGEWYYSYELKLKSGNYFHLMLRAPQSSIKNLKQLHAKHRREEGYSHTLQEFTALLQAKSCCILFNNGQRLDHEQRHILITAIQRCELEAAAQENDVNDIIPLALEKYMTEQKGFNIGWPGLAEDASQIGVFTFRTHPHIAPLTYLKMQRKGSLYRVVFIPEAELQGQSTILWLQQRVQAELSVVEEHVAHNLLLILSGTVKKAEHPAGVRPIILSAESQAKLSAIIEDQRTHNVLKS
jgi:hypothetical protein